MDYIYHYCSFENCVNIVNSKKIRLTRHVLNDDKDELFEGLQLIKSLLPDDNNEWGLGNHLEEIIGEYAYYLVSFTDDPYSVYHREKYGNCILQFNKDKVDTKAWDELGAITPEGADSCLFKCCYDREKNKQSIKGKLQEIQRENNSFMKASIKIELVEKILPVIKSSRSRNDQEYRVFVPKDNVQNDPVYRYDGDNQRRQLMPKATILSCKAYIEFPYGDALKKIFLPENYFNVLDKLRTSNIAIEKYVIG